MQTSAPEASMTRSMPSRPTMGKPSSLAMACAVRLENSGRVSLASGAGCYLASTCVLSMTYRLVGVGGNVLLGKGEALGVDVWRVSASSTMQIQHTDGDHPPGTESLGNSHAKQAHGTTTVYGHVLIRLQVSDASQSVHSNTQRLHHGTVLHIHVVRKLVAHVCAESIVATECTASEWRCGRKSHALAEVVAACLAVFADTADGFGLKSDTVAYFERFDSRADGVNCAG